MRVSIIVSTYNSPEWLEKVIWGYACQSHSDFELLIADDGSDQETFLTISRLQKKTCLSLGHVWHPDEGFRKCRILNTAIEQASGDYLIFSDGDCVPRYDFVATHVRLAKPGRALSGGCVRLPMNISRAIGEQDIFSSRCMRTRWLLNQGMRPCRDLLKLQVSRKIAWLSDLCTPTRATFNGHNASVWRKDALRVNGFDERMKYGGLDREFGERLVNAGTRFRQVRYRAVCLHLDHKRPYVNQESWQRNYAIRAECRSMRLKWTPYGIQQETTPYQIRIAA